MILAKRIERIEEKRNRVVIAYKNVKMIWPETKWSSPVQVEVCFYKEQWRTEPVNVAILLDDTGKGEKF